jgi:hypothetical protein
LKWFYEEFSFILPKLSLKKSEADSNTPPKQDSQARPPSKVSDDKGPYRYGAQVEIGDFNSSPTRLSIFGEKVSLFVSASLYLFLNFFLSLLLSFFIVLFISFFLDFLIY